MLTAYLDESGHTKDPKNDVVSIAGCVASLDAWKSFVPKWKAVLHEFGVSQLHMKNFAHFTGEFNAWLEQRRQDFLGKLMQIMEQNIGVYVGAAVLVSAFRDLTPEQQSQLVDPYFPCFQVCVYGATLQLIGEAPEKKVNLVFAKIPKFVGLATNLYHVCSEAQDFGYRLSSLSFASPFETVQLQAADLVAYELRKCLHDRIYQPDRKLRWPMRKLYRHPTRALFDFFDRDKLERGFEARPPEHEEVVEIIRQLLGEYE